MDRDASFVKDHFAASAELAQAVCDDRAFLQSCERIVSTCVTCLRSGRKILLAGNGGSAGDSQHIAGEFLSRLNFDRAPLAALALSVDTSVLTAVGNDYGYEHVFARQVLGLGRKGDVFIGITTSGRSPNVLRAWDVAREAGLVTIAFCGSETHDLKGLCDVVLSVPCSSTPLIQQIHIAAAHAICGEVERVLFA